MHSKESVRKGVAVSLLLLHYLFCFINVFIKDLEHFGGMSREDVRTFFQRQLRRRNKIWEQLKQQKEITQSKTLSLENKNVSEAIKEGEGK